MCTRARFETYAPKEGVVSVPYFGLARGFLTGKYGSGRRVESATRRGRERLPGRSRRASPRAPRGVAAAHRTTVAAVALAWLAAQPTVVSVLASARTPEQLHDLLPMATLRLLPEELDALTLASLPQPP